MNRLTPMLRSARVLLQEGGLSRVLGALRVFLFCSQRVEVFAAELPEGYQGPRLDPRVEIRRATADDLASLRATAEGHRSEFYRDQIDGAEPFVALWQGQPAHIAWVYNGSHRARFVRLGPGQALLAHGYTREAFRGYGLYGVTAGWIAAELARRGYQRAYGYVIEDSRAFRLGLEWAIRRFGFRKVSTLRHLRVFGIQLRPHLGL